MLKATVTFDVSPPVAAPAVQELALDLLYYVTALQEDTLRMLVLLCLSAAYPHSLAQRAVSIVQHAAAAGRVAADLYLSFLASLLLGQSSQVGAGLLDSSYTRAKQVVSSASRALQTYPQGSGAAQISWNDMLQAPFVVWTYRGHVAPYRPMCSSIAQDCLVQRAL